MTRKKVGQLTRSSVRLRFLTVAVADVLYFADSAQECRLKFAIAVHADTNTSVLLSLLL